MAGGNIYQARDAQILPFRDDYRTDPRGWDRLSEGLQRIVNKDKTDLLLILEGIKSGLLDADDSLTEGTPGGELFKKYFKTAPPMPPEPETVPTTLYPSMRQPDEAEDASLGERAGPGTPGFGYTGKMKGGFKPNSASALKDWVAKKLARGEEVSPQLLQAAGFQPKNLFQLAATDPEAARKLQEMRNDPAKMRAFTALKTAFPDAMDDQIWQLVANSTSTSTPATTSDLGTSEKQQKVKAIGEFKDRELNAKIEHWRGLAQDRGRKLDQQENQFMMKTTGEMLSRLSPIIGFDYAKEVVAALARGEKLEDIPFPDDIKQRVLAEFNRKQQLADARTVSSVTAMMRSRNASAGQEISRERLAAQVEHWNKMYELQSSVLQDRSQNNYIKNNLSLAAKQIQDPNTRAEGEKNLRDIAVNQLGWDVGEPQGFQALKEWVGMLIGVPGLGLPTPSVPATTPKTPTGPRAPVKPGAPFNPPRTAPRGNTTPPRNAQEFLGRYSSPAPTR